MILEAISSIKDCNGSDFVSILRFIEVRQKYILSLLQHNWLIVMIYFGIFNWKLANQIGLPSNYSLSVFCTL